MRPNQEMRSRNPFLDPLVTELIEDPKKYQSMFSERILVGETLQVFQPTNVVVLGAQGSGKSMLLNLIRYSILDRWINDNDAPPTPLHHVSPFLGISVNLVRIAFHAFGRRSVSRAMTGSVDPMIDAICASDYLTTVLFREYLQALDYVSRPGTHRLAEWLGLKSCDMLHECKRISQWQSMYGYYNGCDTIDGLIAKSNVRLTAWTSFLNANAEEIHPDVWSTKTTLEEPLREMGSFLHSLSPTVKPPLFVAIDQYEVIPEMAASHGEFLHRIINTLFKTRDPAVFCKLGARTYDWGKELRVLGAESRIEVQRDYSIIDLGDVLTRSEDGVSVFPALARDVATKRLSGSGTPLEGIEDIDTPSLFGKSDRDREGWIYFTNRDRRKMLERVVRDVKDILREELLFALEVDGSPLEARLAEAWVIQQQRLRTATDVIRVGIRDKHWNENSARMTSWRKERINVALLQVASRANATKRYYGWNTLVQLAGGNISGFLLLCSEIWDHAAKMGVVPSVDQSLSPQIQSEGVIAASRKWLERDRSEQLGGQRRFAIIKAIGAGVRHGLIDNNPGISNPGHSGFSIDDAELSASSVTSQSVATFLRKGVNFAIFEERAHTGKNNGRPRHKYYLHPLLSPVLGIPHTRVKEPRYVRMAEVTSWIVNEAPPNFVMKTNREIAETGQSRILFDIEDEA